MELGVVDEAIAALRAANDALAALPTERLTQAQTTAVLDEMQVLRCQLPSHDHRLLAHLQTETTAKQMGAKSWQQVLATRWRISTSEAGLRLTEAALLGPRATVTGQPLPPLLPATAVAQSHGAINAEHVKVIREALERIPASVDPRTRAQMEIDWARAAAGVGPKKLKNDVNRTIFLLDQDGPDPDDGQRERQRRRGITKAPQQPDGMIALKGVLTPEAWAIVEAIFARWAAPGMCNPADEHPCTAGTPTAEQIRRDDRSLAQRQHDALMQIGKWVLQSDALGTRHGAAATLIIRITMEDLRSRAGVGVTGGGTLLPISDVLALAANADPYLAVFDGATGSAMDMFRARRTASIAQWLMLIARDGGCTKPGCPVPAYGTQVHHATADWADDGQTNVDDMCLACGPDNRMVGPGGWTTRMNEHHDVEWIPPPQLDTNQTRINDYHRPERLYRPPDEDEPAPHADQPRVEPEPTALDSQVTADEPAPQPNSTPAQPRVENEPPPPDSPMTADEPAPRNNPPPDSVSEIDQIEPAPWDASTAWDQPASQATPTADSASGDDQIEPAPWDASTAWDQPAPQTAPQPAAKADSASTTDQDDPTASEPSMDSDSPPHHEPTADDGPVRGDEPPPGDESANADDDQIRLTETNVFTLCARHRPTRPEPDGPETPGGPEPNVA